MKTELREVSPEERAVFNDEFNQHIFEMISSSDNNEKIGGILAICKYHTAMKTIIKLMRSFIFRVLLKSFNVMSLLVYVFNTFNTCEFDKLSKFRKRLDILN